MGNMGSMVLCNTGLISQNIVNVLISQYKKIILKMTSTVNYLEKRKRK